MNRQIKFRAWDKYSKRGMIYPNNGDFIGWHAPSNWKDCYDVMQFTGLLDKNGKEIYEGDIFISKFTGNEKHEVRFGEYNDYFDEENKKASVVGFYAIGKNGEIVGLGKDINGSTKSIEVIGNIYENK